MYAWHPRTSSDKWVLNANTYIHLCINLNSSIYIQLGRGKLVYEDDLKLHFVMLLKQYTFYIILSYYLLSKRNW